MIRVTFPLWNLYTGQEETVRTFDKKQLTGSKLRNFDKVVNCYPVYLTYMQSPSCKIPSWMSYRLESRLLGEISTTADMQMISL